MIRLLLCLSLMLGAQPESCTKTKDDMFTIYLVRHAEKNTASANSDDPELTACGQQRAESLNQFFSSIALDKVYSTNYTRTKSTAQPTASSKGIDIAMYDGDKLQEFAHQLLANKEDALVVGHSNTTAVLAGLLVGQELGEFDLDIYDRIYQVVICQKNGQLQLFHSNFECK
jgi:broad specificity phosphatase PhoE